MWFLQVKWLLAGCVHDPGLLLDFVTFFMDKSSVFIVKFHGGRLRAVLVVSYLLLELRQVKRGAACDGSHCTRCGLTTRVA